LRLAGRGGSFLGGLDCLEPRTWFLVHSDLGVQIFVPCRPPALAHGRTDAAIIFGGKPWDIAAGVILVREAGGAVVDAHGRRQKIGSASTVAAAPELLDQVLDVMPRP